MTRERNVARRVGAALGLLLLAAVEPVLVRVAAPPAAEVVARPGRAPTPPRPAAHLARPHTIYLPGLGSLTAHGDQWTWLVDVTREAAAIEVTIDQPKDDPRWLERAVAHVTYFREHGYAQVRAFVAHALPGGIDHVEPHLAAEIARTMRLSSMHVSTDGTARATFLHSSIDAPDRNDAGLDRYLAITVDVLPSYAFDPQVGLCG